MQVIVVQRSCFASQYPHPLSTLAWNSSPRTPKTFPFSVWYTCGDDSNHAAFPIGDSAEFVCSLYFNQLFFRMTDTVMHLRLQAMIFHCPSMGGVPCISRAKSCQKIFLERWLPTLCYPGCNQQVCDLVYGEYRRGQSVPYSYPGVHCLTANDALE